MDDQIHRRIYAFLTSAQWVESSVGQKKYSLERI